MSGERRDAGHGHDHGLPGAGHRGPLAIVLGITGTMLAVHLAHARSHILDVPHVHEVHDLHASSVASDLPVLTAHVLVDESRFRDRHLPKLLDQLQQFLPAHFDVEHSAIQFEAAGHAAHEHPAHI